jgi:CBS domain containing-hemolysin-like protein
VKKTNENTGKSLHKLKKELNVSLASILILNTVANTLGAAGVGAQASKLFGNEYMFYVSAVLTLVILFVSEIIPKTIGAMYYKELAPAASYVINFFIFITYPLIAVSLFITKKITKDEDANIITREELLESTLISENEGVIDEKESDYIENILSLNKSKVHEILTPRSVIFALEKEKQIKDVINRPGIRKFSRVPLYDGTIDSIVGVVLSKQIFEEAITTQETKLEELMQPIFSINENIPVSYTLDLFIKRKEHMFLVTDSYGQTEGIVTLEDCIETLLGVEIMDELDTTEDMQKLAKDKMKSKKYRKKIPKNH